MNTHELRTSLEKAETELEKKLRKAETNLRFSAQPETKTSSTNDLRKFSARNINSLKFPTHTTTVGSSYLSLALHGLSGPDSASRSNLRSAHFSLHGGEDKSEDGLLSIRAAAFLPIKNLKPNIKRNRSADSRVRLAEKRNEH